MKALGGWCVPTYWQYVDQGLPRSARTNLIDALKVLRYTDVLLVRPDRPRVEVLNQLVANMHRMADSVDSCASIFDAHREEVLRLARDERLELAPGKGGPSRDFRRQLVQEYYENLTGGQDYVAA